MRLFIVCIWIRPRRSIEWGESIRTIALEIPCGEGTVRRWKNEMISELSILLFGVDGLKPRYLADI